VRGAGDCRRRAPGRRSTAAAPHKGAGKVRLPRGPFGAGSARGVAGAARLWGASDVRALWRSRRPRCQGLFRPALSTAQAAPADSRADDRPSCELSQQLAVTASAPVQMLSKLSLSAALADSDIPQPSGRASFTCAKPGPSSSRMNPQLHDWGPQGHRTCGHTISLASPKKERFAPWLHARRAAPAATSPRA
jgi:hypothetical protein